MDSGWGAQDGSIDISNTILKVGGQIGMEFSEMSIETMIGVSKLLIVASGSLVVLAVILFFAFHIPKCIRMVSGRYSIQEKKPQKTKKNRQYHLYTEQLSDQEIVGEEEETVLLGTTDLEMIQDIIYMQDTES